MRLLKRQPGLPFLLALGVLLILSASFLAVQLWSDKVFRGAAEALEAPMMPPTMPPARKGELRAVPGKKIEIAKAAAVEVVAAPEIHEPAEVAEPVVVELSKMVEAPAIAEPLDAPPVVAATPTPVKPVVAKIKETPMKAKEASVVATLDKEVKPAVKVQEKSSVAAVPVKSAPSLVVEQSVSPIVSKKSVQKASVAAPRRSKKETVDTEIPPEWDWFSTPLKMEIIGDNIEIVPTGDVREIRLINVVASLPERSPAPILVDEPASPVVPVLATEMPFASALARMGKLRHSRKVAVKASPEIAKATVAYKSPSLERLQQAVAQLRSKLEACEFKSGAVVQKNADDANTSSSVSRDYEEVPPIQALEGLSADVVSADEVDVSEHKFVPYYGGSGTSLSSRINGLLQRGIGYGRR
ncbi:MAG: hypothetical protein KKB51_21085 [Candidatus Riflebacteria bacterium]|nr:hypothetical protein [Candidatus Riflebacteria bacterium]